MRQGRFRWAARAQAASLIADSARLGLQAGVTGGGLGRRDHQRSGRQQGIPREG